MPDLNFNVENAEALRFAAAPHILFKLRIRNTGDEAIHSVILQCQIQLDVGRRHYSDDEKERLRDLFGEPARWSQTLRSMLWTTTTVVVPAFEEEASVKLQVPCTFDFNVAATKYFAGLNDGDIPVSFYFNGTIFYAKADGGVQVAQISWDKEGQYRLPVRVWKEMMDIYYPNTRWLCLRSDAFERLYRYKVRHGLPTFEQVMETVFQ
jgi:hypothetical protein